MLLLAAALAGGCLSRGDGPRTAAWYDRVRGWTGATAGPAVPADAMILQTTLLDQPAPDPYLSRDLWTAGTATDPLSAEQSALLELNGLRVRVLNGVLPPKFLELVHSDEATVAPMARSAEAGKAKVVPVNGPLARAAFKVRPTLTAAPAANDLDDVECGLSVTATPTKDGRITLRCDPQVQHGERRTLFRPSADGEFVRHNQKPLDSYPGFGWDVPLGPMDYLIIGPTERPEGMLGQAFFHTPAGDGVRQRVLVVRAMRQADVSSDGPPAGPRPRPTAAAAAAQPNGRFTARGANP